MRVWTFAIAGVLAAAISVPASAAKKKAAPAAPVGTFEQCESRAIQLGLPHGQVGHAESVRECMGKRPRNSDNPN